jgi:hypothetical protein
MKPLEKAALYNVVDDSAIELEKVLKAYRSRLARAIAILSVNDENPKQAKPKRQKSTASKSRSKRNKHK